MRKIIHIDMDCFYAAVEVKFRPELKGKALGIGGPPNTRSVLTTASYEARKYGVRSAMPSSQAVRLCPHLILIPPHFDLYKNESRKVREILERFTNKIEPLSLDEAYLDVTDCQLFGGSATLIAQEIRRLIYTELNLTASAGVAPNKFLAKIASDWKKPNGQFVIRPQDVASFVKDLPVEKIFGVGKVTAQKMHDLGLHTCGDIQKYTVLELHNWFGSRAQELYDFARGEDNRAVITEWERKSLTVEETFNRDLQSLEECRRAIPTLYEDFLRRLERGQYEDRIRGIVVKLKFYDFKQTTHEEVARSVPTKEDFERLLEKAWLRRSVPVRLVGLGVRLGSQKKTSEGGDSPQLKFAI
ncbi:DNA polymerase IV [Bdellovibrio bacteriovorus]|uniref:DNA polymerase IV n=1 Tax=Bdellovibrio bacteriovorus TaxID=959 RepID=A0A162GYS8_BDEBC|nr:DNA polymerase IV [Bdellovibrio bacteriovorus]KYG69257.1 DNA polymerase IV [Bdellovibrio bacteriovorus]